MNPCHTRWSVPIESVNPQDAERCEMCGNLKRDPTTNNQLSTVQLASGSMWLLRLAERIMWGGHRPHGIGSVIMCISAKLLNPSASITQLSAATGLTRAGVQCAIERASEIAPDVYQSLWGKKG